MNFKTYWWHSEMDLMAIFNNNTDILSWILHQWSYYSSPLIKTTATIPLILFISSENRAIAYYSFHWLYYSEPINGCIIQLYRIFSFLTSDRICNLGHYPNFLMGWELECLRNHGKRFLRLRCSYTDVIAKMGGFRNIFCYYF